jgi:competence protein ComEC
MPARLVRIDRADGATVRGGPSILVIATGDGWGRLLPGQRVEASGRLSRSRGGDLRAAVLFARLPPDEVGRPPLAQRAAGGLRSGLRRACAPLPDEVAGCCQPRRRDTSRLDRGLARLQGDRHDPPRRRVRDQLRHRRGGVLVRWCRAGPLLSALVFALALGGFVILVRPAPSVLRAAAMGGLALAALAAGRPRAAVPALATTVIVLLVVDPGLAADPGFVLSVLATVGLLLIAPGWAAALRRRRVPRGLAEAVAVPAAAQGMCAPVIAALSATVSLVAVPANLLAAPAVAPATVLGVGATVLSPVSPSAAQFLAWLASWPARWLIWLAHTGAVAPSGALPWPGGAGGGLLLAGLLLAGAGLARFGLLRRVALLTALAALLGAGPVWLITDGWPPTGWFVVACDVGQGDALVLPAAAGQAVVIDTGPSPGPVDRCLRALGVRRVALLVLTHFHADHVGGIDGVLRGRSVTAIVTPGYQQPDAGGRVVRQSAAATGAPVGVVGAGHGIVVGAVRLAVLAPVHQLEGTRSDPNNNSLVIRAAVGRCSVLLTGDAESEEQAELLGEDRGPAVRSDVLKVAHHGSAYQDLRFIGAVAPSVALVSVGRDNDYGLPSGAVLAALTSAGARVLRTDLAGDLAVVARPGGIAVATHRVRSDGRSR